MADNVLDGFRVRTITAKDLGYVARSWKETLYADGQHCSHDAPWRSKARSVFFARVNAPIDVLLKDAIIDVVLDPIDKTYIVGWCCYDAQAIHYVYVRDVLRENGIGQALLERAGITERKPLLVTHWTSGATAKHLQDKYGARYAPELVYSKRVEHAEAKISENERSAPVLARHDTPVQ